MYECGQAATNVGWGLDRIDQRNLPRNNQCNGAYTGAGVDAWIVGTGIWTGASSLQVSASNSNTRVVPKYPNSTEQIPGFINPFTSGLYTSSDDDLGHDTAVSSVVGGLGCGVAPGVTLFAVKVTGSDANGNGTSNAAWTLSGLNYILRNLRPGHRAVVNMSLGGYTNVKNDPQNYKQYKGQIQTAVDKLLAAKVVVVAAAGNGSVDAKNFVPAALPEIITVGATQLSDYSVGSTSAFDQVANYAYLNDPSETGSNFGSVVDVFAPGNFIYINTFNRPNGTRIDYYGNGAAGTSFASPYVAGVIARYLQAYPNATPAQAQSWIVNNATTGKLVHHGLPSGTPDRTLFTSGL